VIYNNLIPGAQLKAKQRSRSSGLRWWHVISWLPISPADIVLSHVISLIYPNFGIDRLSCRFTSFDSAVLNETGLARLKIAIRHERIAFAWAAIGFALIVWATCYATVT
jgi:hypothetical protein